MSVQQTSSTSQTTTAPAFVKFSCELVSYGLLEVLGVKWKYPHYEIKGSRFEKIVGIAAVVFRERHEMEFAQNIADYHVFVLEDVDITLEYLRQFVRKNFKGRVPLMEFLTYCAFLVDLTVCCYEEGMSTYLADLVEETYDVYEEHMKSYFHVVGGWHALGEVARQYVEFVEAKMAYSALEGSNETRTAAEDYGFGNSSRTNTQRSGADGNDRADGNDSNADSNMDVSPEGASVRGEIRADAFEHPSEGGNASHASSSTLGTNDSARRIGSDGNDTSDGNDSNADFNMDDGASVGGELRADAVHDEPCFSGGEKASHTSTITLDSAKRKGTDLSDSADRNDSNADSNMDVSIDGALVGRETRDDAEDDEP